MVRAALSNPSNAACGNGNANVVNGTFLLKTELSPVLAPGVLIVYFAWFNFLILTQFTLSNDKFKIGSIIWP